VVDEVATLSSAVGRCGTASVCIWHRVPLTERPRLGPPLGVEREQQPFAAAEKLRAAHLFADKQKAPPRVP